MLALPPMPSTILVAPRSSAAAMTWPTPNVEASRGAGRPAGSRRRPATSASSITAVPPLTANVVSTGSPVGPSAVTVTG